MPTSRMLVLHLILPAFPCVVQAGKASVSALLDMVTSAVQHLDAASTATRHEMLFAFFLRALDLRRSAASAAEVEAVEAAVVRGIVALTMKLSETQFKPLFLRMVDWAGAATMPQGATGVHADGLS